jgi:hypothetical protein
MAWSNWICISAINQVSIDDLWRYASIDRVANVMRPYLESIVTGAEIFQQHPMDEPWPLSRIPGMHPLIDAKRADISRICREHHIHRLDVVRLGRARLRFRSG